MSNDDALDALIATAMAHDQPPDGAEDQAWAAFAGGLGGGGGGSGAAVPAAAKGLALKVVLGVAAASAVTVGVLQATGEPAPVSSVAATDDAAPTPSPAPEPAAALPRAAPSSPAVSPSPVRASRPSKPLSRRAPRDPEPQTRAQPAAEDASTLAAGWARCGMRSTAAMRRRRSHWRMPTERGFRTERCSLKPVRPHSPRDVSWDAHST